MPQEKKNNLSIFLIKEGVKDHSEIIDNIDTLYKKEIKNETGGLIGILYYPKSYENPPNWLYDFFERSSLGVAFLNSNTRAIFIVEISNRVFALPFGYGKNLLKDGAYEDDFGLFTTLNLIIPNTLKSIEKTDLSLSGKKSKEQLTASGDISNFGVDIEQDLISTVTGKSKIDGLGNIITGRESFHTKVTATYKNISSFLLKYLDFYQKDDYKINFGWIDNIKGIVDKKLIEELNNKLIEKIKKEGAEKIWLAIPEIIDWSDIEGLKYGKTIPKKEKIYEDLYLNDFKNFIGSDIENIQVDDLKKKYYVFCGYDFKEKKFKKWNIYQCIYCEIDYKGDYYVLSNARWYKVQADFVDGINNRYKSIPTAEINLTDYDEDKYAGKGKDKGEYGYNADVANSNDDYILFDRKNINIGGGRNKVEFCDLYSKSKKQLIHIKKYGGSNVFSHLFNQGIVSGELLLSELKFRQGVNSILSDDCKFKNIEQKPKADEYHIIFAIISGKKGDLDIPFFSKVSLSNVHRKLQIMNFNVYKAKILKI